MLYSVAARASVEIWRAAADAPRQAFSEAAFRLPAYLVGLGTIALVALLLAQWGFARAAPVAAWLLALHPWHFRYGVEGRGYSFLIGFAALGAWTLHRALERGRWRDWGLFAASQVAMLWAQPVGIFLTAGFGVCALAAIVRRDEPTRDRVTRAGRAVVANGIAGMLLLQLLAPNLAQSLTWTEVREFGPRLGLGTLESLWTRLAIGMRPIDWPPGAPAGAWPTLESLPAAASWIVFGVVPLLAGVGLVRALRSPDARWPIAAFLVALVAALASAAWNQAFFYDRFLCYLLVPLVAAVALGADAAARALPWPERVEAAGARGLLAAIVVGFALLAWPQNATLHRHPMTGLRDATELLARASGDHPDAILRAGFGLGGEIPRVYDPRVQYVDDADGLAALVSRAERSGRALYVLSSYQSLNRRRRPDGFAWLDDRARFSHVAHFPGIEPRFSYDVYRFPPSESESESESEVESGEPAAE